MSAADGAPGSAAARGRSRRAVGAHAQQQWALSGSRRTREAAATQRARHHAFRVLLGPRLRRGTRCLYAHRPSVPPRYGPISPRCHMVSLPKTAHTGDARRTAFPRASVYAGNANCVPLGYYAPVDAQSRVKKRGKWDAELQRLQNRQETGRIAARGAVTALCILASALPLRMGRDTIIVRPFAGHTTVVHANIAILIGIALSLTVNGLQWLKDRSQKQELRRLRKRAEDFRGQARFGGVSAETCLGWETNAERLDNLGADLGSCGGVRHGSDAAAVVSPSAARYRGSGGYATKSSTI